MTGKEKKFKLFLKAIFCFTGWPMRFSFKKEEKISRGLVLTKDIEGGTRENLEAFIHSMPKSIFVREENFQKTARPFERGIRVLSLNDCLHFPCVGAGKNLGIKSIVTIPILSKGQLVAIIEIFSPKILRKNSQLISLFEEVSFIFSDSIKQEKAFCEKEVNKNTLH